MQILIYGFARSGTTLMRRLVALHPDVKKIIHEQFVLRRQPRMLKPYLQSYNIDIKRDNWGEKVPYVRSVRRISVVKYCQLWMDIFNKGKIIHIVRHPYDVAFSFSKKSKKLKNFNTILTIHNNKVSKVLKFLEGKDCVLNVKYEELLMNTDKVVSNIYSFCGLNPEINYTNRMAKIKNPKYQSIDSSRAFSYKNKDFEVKVDVRKVLKEANKIEGVKYKL